MVSTIRYSANASSDHHPNQVPGILIIMNPKQPNLPTCSVTSTYLLFHLLSNPSLHLIANTTLGIIMTAIKISPKTLNHSCKLSARHNFHKAFWDTPGAKEAQLVAGLPLLLSNPLSVIFIHRRIRTICYDFFYSVCSKLNCFIHELAVPG